MTLFLKDLLFGVWRVFRTIGKYTPQEGHSKKSDMLSILLPILKLILKNVTLSPLKHSTLSPEVFCGNQIFWFCRYLGAFEPAYPVGRWRGARKKQSFHLEKEPVDCFFLITVATRPI